MNDLINRQMAIDAVLSIEHTAKLIDGDAVVRMSAVNYVLKNLPSAELEIIHCKDCKHHWTHKCMDGFTTEICDLKQIFYDADVDFCSLAEKRERIE